MSTGTMDALPRSADARLLVYRQSIWTRVTHWIWAIALFFLLLSGLQIFNAHPSLYIGTQSGFQFDNAVLSMQGRNTEAGPKGITTVFGKEFDTTGVFGLSGSGDDQTARGFPAWATIPSYQDLGTGRVVHFFFAWIFAVTATAWLVGSLFNGHIWRDLRPRLADWRNLPRDIADHARLRFHHTRSYNTLQKLSYGVVLFVLFPLIILTGLAMSPTMNSLVPLPELFGGRQTARTIHFTVMVLLVLFFVVHVLMVVAAGPINELRSMITGWYRVDRDADRTPTRGA